MFRNSKDLVMKVVSIHQGHFLPWLGYWNKVVNADVFIWLDTVQYRKNYFQNRAHIKTLSGAKAWLTVPVTFSSDDTLAEVRIAAGKRNTRLSDWKKKVLNAVRLNYCRAPFYNAYYGSIAEIIQEAGDMLDDLNYDLFLHIKKLLGYEAIDVCKASSLDVPVKDPTERLVAICRYFNVTHYIAGRGGANYMDMARFQQAGINVIWQCFHENQPVYEQINGQFVAGLSVIDSLFNVGAEETASLIRQSWIAKDTLLLKQDHA
jgi:hypothetical protein